MKTSAKALRTIKRFNKLKHKRAQQRKAMMNNNKHIALQRYIGVDWDKFERANGLNRRIYGGF